MYHQTTSSSDICPYCHSGRQEYDFFMQYNVKGVGNAEKSFIPFKNKYFREFKIEDLPITRLDEDMRRLIYNLHRKPSSSQFKGSLNEKLFWNNDPEWNDKTKFDQQRWLAERIKNTEFVKEIKRLNPTNVSVKLALPRFNPKAGWEANTLNILGLIDIARLAIWVGAEPYNPDEKGSLEGAIERLKSNQKVHGMDVFRTFKVSNQNLVSHIPSIFRMLFNFLLQTRSNAGGLPDFLVYNTSGRFFYFVECKANSAELSDKQREIKQIIQNEFAYLQLHRQIDVNIEVGESKLMNSELALDQSIQNVVDQLEKKHSILKNQKAKERVKEQIFRIKLEQERMRKNY